MIICYTNREYINARCNLSYIEFITNKVSHKEAFNTSRYCVISLRAVLRCAVENLAMSFKLHICTHGQDIVQRPSKVSIIVYNMYLEGSEMCV